MLRFGVIGAGAITKTFCDAVNQHQGELYAIASRHFEKAKNYQDTYGFQKAYGDYEQMLSDPLVECVYIATPHGLHYEHMLLALKHKKHILCEKAFTLNEKQAKHIFELSKEYQCFVMEALWTRFLPITKTLKTLIDDHIIGDINLLEAEFSFSAPKDLEKRLFNPHLGGGALLDIGIYPINYANIFLGEPNTIKSHCEYAETQVDITNHITYEYPSAYAKLTASFAYDKPRTATIYGTEGFITIPNFWSAETAMIYNKAGQLVKTLTLPHLVNGFEYQIEETIRCIKENRLESPLMPHQETLKILRQMDYLRSQWNIRYPQEK